MSPLDALRAGLAHGVARVVASLDGATETRVREALALIGCEPNFDGPEASRDWEGTVFGLEHRPGERIYRVERKDGTAYAEFSLAPREDGFGFVLSPVGLVLRIDDRGEPRP